MEKQLSSFVAWWFDNRQPFKILIVVTESRSRHTDSLSNNQNVETAFSSCRRSESEPHTYLYGEGRREKEIHCLAGGNNWRSIEPICNEWESVTLFFVSFGRRRRRKSRPIVLGGDEWSQMDFSFLTTMKGEVHAHGWCNPWLLKMARTTRQISLTDCRYQVIGRRVVARHHYSRYQRQHGISVSTMTVICLVENTAYRRQRTEIISRISETLLW